MRKLIYTSLLLILSYNIYSQNDLPKTNRVDLLVNYDSTYILLNNYLIDNNYIEKENNTIYLFNMLSWNEFDLTDSCGIYVFGLKESEPTYFLFFENKDKSYTIIQKNSLPLILNAAMVFFEKNDIEDKEIQLFYMLSILKFFDSDNEYLLEEKYLPRDWKK
ncbi:MAG: hypothetical protein JEZ03_17290 [Bacteroidales bacterium]|nr:hypothetical protein [Bacteroidales bacterium]